MDNCHCVCVGETADGGIRNAKVCSWRQQHDHFTLQ